MAEIDHEARRNPGLGAPLARGIHARGVVVGLAAPAQNDMEVLVPGRGYDGGVPALGHREEMMRRLGGANRVHGDLDVATRAVLETDRARQAGSELAMDLRLRRA